MGDENAAKGIAEPLGQGEVQHFLSQQAKQHNVWLIGGDLYSLRDYYNEWGFLADEDTVKPRR